MPDLSPSFRRESRGFTLIELLVSCGITMVLMMLVVSIVSGVLDHSQRIRNSSESTREISAAVETLAKDIEALFIPQQSAGSALKVEVVEARSGIFIPQITLLSQAPDADAAGSYPGTVRSISYQTAYQDPVPHSTANPRLGLYRAIAPGADTFATLLDAVDPQSTYWSTSAAPDPVAWNNLIADRLHSLQLRFQRADTGAWIDPADDGASIRIDRNGAYSRLSGGNETRIPGGISAIEISLVVLDEMGERRVRDNVWTSDEAAQAHGHHLTRRTVVLPRNLTSY